MNNHPSIYLILFFAFLLTSCGAKKSTFDSAKLGTAERDVTYCTMNSLPQKMDIYYPASKGPWPVLVYVHGGSWYQGDKAEGEGWRGMNDRGFLVVSVNYRLGDYQTKFPAMIEDVKCAVRYLRAHSSDYNIDPDRIYLTGHSMGGYGTWSVAMNHPDVFAALAPVAGGANVPAAMSKIAHIPQLVVHGDNDPTVPVERSRVMVAEGKKLGVEIKYIEVPGGDHMKVIARNPENMKKVFDTFAQAGRE